MTTTVDRIVEAVKAVKHDKDCVIHAVYPRMCNCSYFDDLRKSIASVLDEKVTDEEWISVHKKLPEDKQRVLIVQPPSWEPRFAEYAARERQFTNPGGTIDGFHLCVSYWSNVLFWRPLPPFTNQLKYQCKYCPSEFEAAQDLEFHLGENHSTK